MDISYMEIIPDVDTYHALRTSVDWNVFCREQSEKALQNSCYCVIAKVDDQTVTMGRAVGKEGFYEKQGFKILPNENAGPACRKDIYS